jgi:hypothetical protein
MRLKNWGLIASICAIALVCCNFDGCDDPQTRPQTASNNPVVHKVDVAVKPGADGLTAEQRNIQARLIEDNKSGAIKHLYVISPYSGQVILYSTVKGKVTSGGKRLSPTNVAVIRCGQNCSDLPGYDFNGHETGEVLQDDGTYGTSGDYLYWWDVRGSYHQHYLTGGQIVTISDQPLPVKSVTINIEAGGRE